MMTHSRKHERVQPNDRIIVHNMDEVPEFADECEEVEYWDTHEPAAELFQRAPLDPDEEAALARIRERRTAARRTG
jgi:hypothetical protein